jgi:hypothetical protein
LTGDDLQVLEGLQLGPEMVVAVRSLAMNAASCSFSQALIAAASPLAAWTAVTFDAAFAPGLRGVPPRVAAPR